MHLKRFLTPLDLMRLDAARGFDNTTLPDGTRRHQNHTGLRPYVTVYILALKTNLLVGRPIVNIGQPSQLENNS